MSSDTRRQRGARHNGACWASAVRVAVRPGGGALGAALTLASLVTVPVGGAGAPAQLGHDGGASDAIGSSALVEGTTVTAPARGGSIPPSDTFSYWLQVGAHATGVWFSQWRTDLGLLNPGSHQANVTVYLYPAGGGTALTKSTYVPAGVQSVLADLVGQLGYTGSGSVEVRSDQPLLVTSRTYNLVSSSATCTPGGTFGQYYGAYTLGESLGTGESAWLPHLSESTRFRTNLAFTNIGSTTATLQVDLFDGAGASVKTFVRSLGPSQYMLEGQVFKNRAGLTDLARGSARVTVTSGWGVITSASVVDNTTNDATTIPMLRLESVGPSPQELTVMLPGDVELVLVKVPHGTFTMGAPPSEPGAYDWEGPQHQVTLTQDYFMGKYEVTQRQWVAVMGTNPSYFSSCGLDCPVEQVSWNDICGGTTGSACTAASFIGKLNAYLGSTKFRLPTEAEWEYAARGGTTGPFSFATPSNWDPACGSFPEAAPYMWWCHNSGSTPHPVGSKQPNPYGLYDMHGSVWEWVGDWYGDYSPDAVTNPTGPSSGSIRVYRGGSFDFGAGSCRSSHRQTNPPHLPSNDHGFRLARSQ